MFNIYTLILARSSPGRMVTFDLYNYSIFKINACIAKTGSLHSI